MTANPILRMFDWWNQAYVDRAFTPEAFSRHFTDDAPFIVDGNVRGVGPHEIDAHFQRIRAATDHVRLEASTGLADDTVGFVRYRSSFQTGDRTGCEECVAVASLRDGKIASIEVFQSS